MLLEGAVPDIPLPLEQVHAVGADIGFFVELAPPNAVDIVILVEKDERMLNFINIIPCNPEKMPKVDAEGAEDFINWLVSDEAQKIIAEFGVDKYGEQLFFPNAGSDVF